MLSSFENAFGVEVVRQVEPPRRQGQPLGEQLGSKPDLTQVQRVLRSSRAVYPFNSVKLGISASGGDPLRATMSAKKTVFWAMPAVKNRSADARAYAWLSIIGSAPSVRFANWVRDRRIDADFHVVLFGIGQRLFDFFADGLAAVNALASIGDGTLRSGNLFVVFVPVCVNEHLDAADARFRLGQNGVRFQVGHALFEFRHLLQQLLPLRIGGLRGGGGIERDVELDVLIRGDRDTLPAKRRQARRDDGDGVGADGKRPECVRALRVGRRFEARPRCRVDGHHRRVGDRRVARPPHRSPYAAAMIHVHLRHVGLLRSLTGGCLAECLSTYPEEQGHDGRGERWPVPTRRHARPPLAPDVRADPRNRRRRRCGVHLKTS